MSNFEAIEASYSFLPAFSRPEDSACSFVILAARLAIILFSKSFTIFLDKPPDLSNSERSL